MGGPQLGPVCLLGALLLLGVGSAAWPDPLQENLQKLQERARRPVISTRPAPPPAPRGRSGRPPRRLARRLPHAAAAARPTPAVTGPARYEMARFGVRPRAGDLQVEAAVPGEQVHVYFQQRIVSRDGDGIARVPDLPPGKYPVLVWQPGAGRRRTIWVSVRRDQVAVVRTPALRR